MNVTNDSTRSESAVLKRALVAQEAADWFVANSDGLDAQRREEFARWLRESPVHVEEYLAIAHIDRDLPAASADPGVPLGELIERARAAEDTNVRDLASRFDRKRESRPWNLWSYAGVAAAAAGVAAVALLSWSQLRVNPAAVTVAELRYATRHGEQMTQRLSDGSVLHLNTDTSVRVLYGAARREVRIERGQAEFEVVHQASRPFHVIAGSAEVVDVGTTFDVYLRPDATVVTVVEGRVSVGRSPLLDSPGTPRAPVAPLYVDAGQQVRVVGGEPSSPLSVDARRVTAWERGQLPFEQTPLEEVVAELNRYGATPIEIETPSLRTLAISGVFAADDTESFIAFLRSLDGVQVEVTATRIRVYREASKR